MLVGVLLHGGVAGYVVVHVVHEVAKGGVVAGESRVQEFVRDTDEVSVWQGRV